MPKVAIDRFFVVDFDRCIGNVDATFGLLKDVLDDLSIMSREDIQQARSQVEEQDKSFDAIEYVASSIPGVDLLLVKRRYIELAAQDQGSLLEPGAKEFIDYLKESNSKFCIMSYGNDFWQRLKIIATGFGDESVAIVGNKYKAGFIAGWKNSQTGYFDIPGSYFADGKGRTAREVILVDDKPIAFEGLPIGARGYLVQGSVKIHQSDVCELPPSVEQVVRVNEIIKNLS
ncbi:MAG: hypothetical protein WCI79_03095 [Candidatus Saccharibacteria bacterium]